jgi:hypothetical protein
MEVHAHSHTPRKKWTHYFWEFLMLFLAVFCGFLAEYTLEHKIEKTREKQFIQSLMNDLKADTANITGLNTFRLSIQDRSDSLFDLLTSKSYAKKGFETYHHGSYLSRRAFFYSADGTMQQLKNSGGLRLIRNVQIADSIKAYDVLYRNILQLQVLEEDQVIKYKSLAGRVFDAAILVRFYWDRNLSKDSTTFFEYKLGQSNPELINELCNSLTYRSGNSGRIHLELERLKEKAVHLIELIKNKYHIE